MIPKTLPHSDNAAYSQPPLPEVAGSSDKSPWYTLTDDVYHDIHTRLSLLESRNLGLVDKNQIKNSQQVLKEKLLPDLRRMEAR